MRPEQRERPLIIEEAAMNTKPSHNGLITTAVADYRIPVVQRVMQVAAKVCYNVTARLCLFASTQERKNSASMAATTVHD